MTLSTNLVAGLASGFDWRSMIDQLIAIEHRRVDLVEDKKSEYESRLSAWQSFNTKLLSLKTAVEGLKKPENFYLYTTSMSSDSTSVEASDILSATATSSASQASHTITVSSIATAQKLSSKSFSSLSEELGSSFEGDILINGIVINIEASDNIADIRDKINNANTGDNPSGVTASIVSYGTNDYRLILTSDNTGEEGISILNASSNDILGNLGFIETASNSYEVKNEITGGAQSDRFTSVNNTIKSLLGLNTSPSSTTLIIKDTDGVATNSISIDLANDDLYDIRDAINNNKGSANITASVVSETVNGSTYYRLQIDGINATDPFSDDNNIFQTLGLIKGGVGDVVGVTGTEAMTTDGQVIDTTTLLVDIDGYLEFTTGDKIDFSGYDTSGGSVTYTFNIDTTTTVQDLLNAIEDQYGDVTAYITSEGKIQIVDNTTDTPSSSSLQVTLTDTISNGTLDFGLDGATSATIRKRELVEGSNASLTIDGVNITSAENTIDDVIEGVTLNLIKADPDTTITLNVNRDIDGIVNKITEFVDKYNEVASYIYQQQSYDEQNESTGGVLFGDSTLSSVKADLTSAVVQQIWGVSSSFSILGQIGINLDNEGKLNIDSDTLRGYLETNFNDVKNLFVLNGTTSTGTLGYISCSRATQPGEYTVNITTVPTRSTSTSDNGTVGEDETITITEGDKVAQIELTTSMTLEDIKDAINSELSEVYTETLVGDRQLFEGSGGTTVITSSTTWNNVYIDSVNSANLANNDIISFEGTTRLGRSVSGSYQISDITQDTVQGLLSAIEAAYGNEVTASIDDSGRIVVTDKKSGNSQLSIEFDYTNAHDLTFGSSVSASNPGGQEGRYALDITATDDGNGHLVLTHNNYGSSYSFTISEDAATAANKLWTGGDQTVDNGVDVAGTINGEAATGSGQILTGDDGDNNVEGLVIRYTGSSTGDVGTVKITLGVAELLDRALYSITDTYDGYVAYKQKSLQDTINKLDRQIEEMEARLDQKMERMINQFVAMEVALSKMQNQSSWLSGQINAAYKAWGL